MTYTEQTAVRLLRCIVADGASVYVPPVRRQVLRTLLDALTDLQNENAALRQAQAEERRATNAVPQG